MVDKDDAVVRYGRMENKNEITDYFWYKYEIIPISVVSGNGIEIESKFVAVDIWKFYKHI